MIKILALLLLFSAFQLSAQNNGDQLFDPEFLHEIKIVSSNANLLEDMYNQFFLETPGNHSYFQTDVIIDGQPFGDIGLRIKGGSSLFSDKKPMKIDFDYFVDGQKFDGLNRVNLHNAHLDPTFLREAASYDILREAGLKAPRTAFTKVYINDIYQGVYLLVESIDKVFFKDYFASNDGVLYKNIADGVAVWNDEGTLDQYNLLISTVNDFNGLELKERLDEILDTKAYLTQLAVQLVIGTVDNILTANNNYFIYHEPKADLLYFVPWDYNLSFLSSVNYSIYTSPASSLAQKMFEVPAYKNKFYEIICEILDYNFTVERLNGKLQYWFDLINEAVQTDSLFEYSYEEFVDGQTTTKDWMVARVSELNTELIAEIGDCEMLNSPIPFQGIVINEIVASNDSLGGEPDLAGDFPDWIELYNNNNVDYDLSDFYLSDDKDFKKHWAFPDNLILGANEYLIIWADRDLDEAGLHTDFKLAKAGGSLFLSYKNFEIIDSLSYDLLEENEGFARVPNGFGDFQIQTTTFNGINNPVNTLLLEDDPSWIIYPNPVNEELHILLPLEFEKNNWFLSISDYLGKGFYSGKDLVIDLSTYPAGVYIIKINRDKKGHERRKLFIKQ